MKDQLQNYMGRPKRYENIDGTGEMALGVMMLSFALVGYLSAVLPEGALWRKNGLATFEFIPVVMIPSWAFQHWGVKGIKKRFTWPRTGYVAYRRSGWPWWKLIVAILVASAVFGAATAWLMGLARRFHALSLERAVYLAVPLAAYAFFVVRWSREHAWKWLVLIFMALGLVAIALAVPGGAVESFPPVALFLGLVWLGSGVATLYSYIRHTQPPAPQAE
jgi:MFS family permease